MNGWAVAGIVAVSWVVGIVLLMVLSARYGKHDDMVGKQRARTPPKDTRPDLKVVR